MSRKINPTVFLFRNSILSFILFFSLQFIASGLLSAQNSLKQPVVFPLGQPRVIKIPITTGGSYTTQINNKIETIQLEPLKKFNLPVVTTLLVNDKPTEFSSQFAVGQGLFTTYTSDNGLVLDGVSSSCIDHFGNIWFGTQGGGVSKFDGKLFERYTTDQGLAGNTIQNIIEDKAGNIWFSTYGSGISRYDGKYFLNFTTTNGLTSNNVYCVMEDSRGNLWIGTSGGGVSKFDGKSFENYTTTQGLSSNIIRCITEDKSGNIWFGTDGGGISKFNGKSFVNYTTAQGLPSNSILSIITDKTGNIWFGTNGGGLCKYDGKTFINFTTAQGLANNIVWSAMEDKSGNLWFGTEGGGVSEYNGKSFTNFSTIQGLANNNVRSIAEDISGNIWFSTFGGGVSKYAGKTFINYTDVNGLPNNVILCITEDREGNFWFGTNGGGVNKFDGKSFVSYTTAQGLINNTVISIAEDKAGNIWFGTVGGGVSKFDGKSFANYTTAQGLASNNIYSINEDKAGNIWFSTYGGGINIYDGKHIVNYTTDQGLTNNKIWCTIIDRKGNFWFGTEGGGVSKYDGKSFVNYTTAQGLASNTILCITEDDIGNLWFGTDGYGISKFNGKSFVNYTTAQGLPDNNVTQIINSNSSFFSEARQGKDTSRLFVGTNLGVCEIISSFNKVEVKQIYNSVTGYPIKDVNAGQHAMYKDSKGIIWIATGSDKTGLVRFDSKAIYHSSNPPTVLIQNIKVDEENICWENIYSHKYSHQPTEADSLSSLVAQFQAFGKSVPKIILDNQLTRFGDIQFDSIIKFYPIPVNLILPYNHNQISFDFIAIEHSHAGQIKYQYILEGYNKEWSPVTDKTSVNFGRMYEGTYTFKIKAQNSFSVWSKPTTYTFTVLPPWWRRWWMYALYIVFGICFVWFVSWWNSRRLKKRSQELSQQVREATKTIEEQKRFVEAKNKHITESINYAQRIQNAILPANEFIKNLFNDHFIFFQPKEIVSGDFYWIGHKGDKIIFAAVDCTGHGVPGAFMSMIGNTLLNEIVNEKGIVESDKILNHLRAGIIYSLKQTAAQDSQKDGMDVSLCVFDRKKKLLEFSGAHNSLYHFRDTVFTEYKGDQQDVSYENKENPFTKTIIETQKGDTIYIFTDGFVDQKGEISKRKFYYRSFRELLASLQQETMIKQEAILRDTFNTWKGKLDQIDDVLVIGIRL